MQDYIRLLDKNVSGLNNSHLTGSLNTKANSMAIDADIPAFAYKQYAFSEVKLSGSGNLDSLILTGSATDASLGGGVVLPQTTFSIRAANDVSDIVLNTTSNQAINRASIATRLKTYNDGIALEFAPSSFMINGKAWIIEQGGELNLRKSAVANGQLVLREGVQEIKIETVASDVTNGNDLHVTLQNLNLGDLSPLIIKDSRIEGTLSGKIVLDDPTEKLLINADLKGSAIKLDNDSLGDILINGSYNNLTGMLTAKGANTDPEHKIDFDVAMNLNDTAHAFQNRISLRAY